MTSYLLRHLWQVIEVTPTGCLLNQVDQQLIESLVHQINHDRTLSDQECQVVTAYLRDHLRLIRDMADSRPHVLNSMAA
jgi:uncharacterized membrane protein YvbJ